MKKIIFASMMLSFAAIGAGELESLKREAGLSIAREYKALESSKFCIETAKTVDALKNCNYHPQNFNVQKEEEKKRVEKREL